MGRLMRYSLRKTPRSAKSARQCAAAVARRGGEASNPHNKSDWRKCGEACFPQQTKHETGSESSRTSGLLLSQAQAATTNARFVPPQNQHLCIGLLTSQIVEGPVGRNHSIEGAAFLQRASGNSLDASACTRYGKQGPCQGAREAGGGGSEGVRARGAEGRVFLTPFLHAAHEKALPSATQLASAHRRVVGRAGEVRSPCFGLSSASFAPSGRVGLPGQTNFSAGAKVPATYS